MTATKESKIENHKSQIATPIAQKYSGLRGFTRPNLFRMRQFYETYRGDEKVSSLLRQLPWTHNLLILSKSKRPEEREFYLRMATSQKWSSRELERQLNGAVLPGSPRPRRKEAARTAVDRRAAVCHEESRSRRIRLESDRLAGPGRPIPDQLAGQKAPPGKAARILRLGRSTDRSRNGRHTAAISEHTASQEENEIEGTRDMTGRYGVLWGFASVPRLRRRSENRISRWRIECYNTSPMGFYGAKLPGKDCRE